MGNSTLNCIIQSDERNCQDWGFASFCESDSLNGERKTGRGEVHRINRTITGSVSLFELSETYFWNNFSHGIRKNRCPSLADCTQNPEKARRNFEHKYGMLFV